MDRACSTPLTWQSATTSRAANLELSAPAQQRLHRPRSKATARAAVAEFVHSGGRIRTCDLRVMSPTSYLTAPPRGGRSMLATALRPGLAVAAIGKDSRPGAASRVRPCSGLRPGRGDRHRHQLDAPADRRRQPAAGSRRSSGAAAVTRLGRGVDLSGQLSAEAIEAACEAIADYVALYAGGWRRERRRDRDQRGPRRLKRRAPSSPSCASASRSRRGCSTARRRPGSPTSAPLPSGRRATPTLVIDIGGGSTELIVGTGSEISFHASLQAGVVRHTERHIASDPPTAVELEALAGRRPRPDRDRASPGSAGESRSRNRRRRDPDLAGRDRDGTGAL